jgi:hypothetical protein
MNFEAEKNPHWADCPPVAGTDGKSRETPPMLARLTLLHRLQASLVRSRRALLASDLGEIGSCTKEQRALREELQDQLRRRGTTWTRAENGSQFESGPEDNAEPAAGLLWCEAELRAALRLQLVLLRKSGERLRVLANMLSGPTVEYRPPNARKAELAIPSEWQWKRAG